MGFKEAWMSRLLPLAARLTKPHVAHRAATHLTLYQDGFQELQVAWRKHPLGPCAQSPRCVHTYILCLRSRVCVCVRVRACGCGVRVSGPYLQMNLSVSLYL
jgi:hypothetical protein